MCTFIRRFMVPALALGLAAAFVSGPAHAASMVTAKAYTLDQLSTLPPETPITIYGKTVTVGAMRAAHQALVARFQSVGSLKSLLTFGPLVRVPVKGTNVILPRPLIAGQAPSAAPSPSSAPSPGMKHVTTYLGGPIDYAAACSQHSVCVYMPPGSSGFSHTDGGNFVNVDPLMSASVCAQDGGVMVPEQAGGGDAPVSMCAFFYPYSATISAFPGNPPAMQAQTAQGCSNSDFSTQIDPMGAAAITFAPNTPSTQPLVCAIELWVPSS